MKRLILFVIVLLLFVSSNSSAQMLKGTAYTKIGYSTEFENPFSELVATLTIIPIYLNTTVTIRTDVVAPIGGTYYMPIRSIYTTKTFIKYKFMEFGWFHECTHRGDCKDSIILWDDYKRALENDFYFKLTLKGGL